MDTWSRFILQLLANFPISANIPLAMWQSYIFGMHWRHEEKMYYDELPAESMEEAAEGAGN